MSGRKRFNKDGRPLEYGVKEDIKAVLDSLPHCFYFMPSAGVFGISGVSDFIGLCNGRFFAVEAKRDDKPTPTVPQRIFLAAIRRARGFARRIDATNVHTLRQLLVAHCGLVETGDLSQG